MRDGRPEEKQVEQAEAGASEVEVVDAEAAEEDGEEDTGDLVLAGAFVLGVEPGALLVVHTCGVDAVGIEHWGTSCMPMRHTEGRGGKFRGGLFVGTRCKCQA